MMRIEKRPNSPVRGLLELTGTIVPDLLGRGKVCESATAGLRDVATLLHCDCQPCTDWTDGRRNVLKFSTVRRASNDRDS